MDIKETKDVLNLVKVVVIETVKEIARDGFQPQDLGAFLKSPQLDKAVAEAVSGAEKVPAEILDLSLIDDVQLAKFGYDMLSEAIAAFKAARSQPAA